MIEILNHELGLVGFVIKVDNVVADKSKAFAIRVIKMHQYLCDEKKEYILSKQVLRSGTSIGANIKEAVRAYSKNDFVFKMNISLKEASETEYWLELLHQTGYISDAQFDSMKADCTELIKIITSILKTAQKET